jgi:cytochrome c-type biogenesis protein CcmE
MTDAWKRRLFAIIALTIAFSALALISMGDLGEDLIYYWSPTELRAAENAQDATVRLGGMVVPGTVEWDKDAGHARFQVTDGKETVDVYCNGNPPQMFRAGIGVVVEGQLHSDNIFRTSRVMVKHSNEYEAPAEGEGHTNPYATLAEET